jgi:Domain of unknown function (DUF6285)
MQDRPTVDELLRAVEILLDEQLVPTLDGSRKYNARVAANVIRTVRRELQNEERQLDAEWRGLDVLLGPAERPATLHATRQKLIERNRELADRIREGHADAGRFRELTFAHVRDTVHAKLEVSDPGWLSR